MIYENIEFRLTDNFLSQFKGKQPKWGPVGYFTYKRTYARQKDGRRTEEFWETLQRVVEGTFLFQKLHCKKMRLPFNNRRAQTSAQEMFQRMWDFKFLPPGRGLWAMGSDYVFDRGGVPLNNCGFVSTLDIDSDFSSPFVWVMDMSLMGVGCGFDTRGTEKEVFLKKPRRTSDTHIVEDSREGWVELARRVLDSFSGCDSLPKDVDYSKIRPIGELIKGFGGVAPGHEPLKQLYESLISLLTPYAESDTPIDSTLIVDIMNYIGATVVAGGIRRTAEIAFGDLDDLSFLDLKNYSTNKEAKDKPRWASNNSIFAHFGMDYRSIAGRIAANGEPGLLWLDNARRFGRMGDPPDDKDQRAMGANPCAEQTLESYELCNLVETFPIAHEDLDDYKRTLKYAYMYAKTVTLVLTNDERTNQIMGRNRRIGVSQSGIVENIALRGLSEHIKWCEEGYSELKKWDDTYSEWMCIPKSKKITSIKPSGTVSLLPGRTPGIHFPHSKWYVRRVTTSKSSPLWKKMKDAGYKVEASKTQPESSMVVEFPIEEEHFWRAKSAVSMWEQFALASLLQRHWADNQVSITVTFNSDEVKDIPHVLAAYERQLKSVSLLPYSGHQYEQAPYEEISEKEYKSRVAKIKKLKLTDFENKEFDFCDGDSCTIT